MSVHGVRVKVVEGGEGGEGNAAIGQAGRGIKRNKAASAKGGRATLRLTVKVVADVALVGLPNAGKSTFLAAVTNAKPKIADYPFTTIIPNLGVCENGVVLCDVPGLIEGASDGVGLGHAFLRHVERCHLIVHLVDATSADIKEDYKLINNEIARYANGILADKPQVVALNKIDLLRSDEEKEAVIKELRIVMTHTRLATISARKGVGVKELETRLKAFLTKVKAAS
jgi:GTP-binding protein